MQDIYNETGGIQRNTLLPEHLLVSSVVFTRQLLLQHPQQLDPALVCILLLEPSVLGLLGKPGERSVHVPEEESGHDVLAATVHFLVEGAHGGGDFGGGGGFTRGGNSWI